MTFPPNPSTIAAPSSCRATPRCTPPSRTSTARKARWTLKRSSARESTPWLSSATATPAAAWKKWNRSSPLRRERLNQANHVSNRSEPLDWETGRESIGQALIRGDELRFGLHGKGNVETVIDSAPIIRRNLKSSVQQFQRGNCCELTLGEQHEGLVSKRA